jgi:hypothetical protein
MIVPEKIQNFYEANLKSKLETLEEQRKAIVRKLKLLIGGYIVLMVVLIMILFATPEAWFLSIIGIILVTIGLVYFYNKWVSPYNTHFKKEIVSRIVTFMDENLIYLPENKLTLYEFTASRLQKYWLPPRVRRRGFFNNWGWEVDRGRSTGDWNWEADRWGDTGNWNWEADRWGGTVIYRSGEIDRWSGEDYVEGLLGSTAVKFSEVQAQYEEISEYCCDDEGYLETSTRYHTVFDGLFFVFDFNKGFKGFTVVLPENDRITRIVGELVYLGYPEFEREFVVYSDNQVMARNVLSPSLMRRILTFRRQLGQTVCLSFFNGKLYLGISIRKDLFEAPGIFKSLLDDFGYVYEYLEYMHFAKDIVEDLNLNTLIWNQGAVQNFQETNPAVLSDDNLTKMIIESA